MYAAYTPCLRNALHRPVTDKKYLYGKNDNAYGDIHPVYAHKNYAAYGRRLAYKPYDISLSHPCKVNTLQGKKDGRHRSDYHYCR